MTGHNDAPTILIVADDACARELLVRNLQHAGHRVMAAGTDHEALQLLAHDDLGIALVLAAISVSHDAKVELVAECRKRGKKIIGMTGDDALGSVTMPEGAEVHLLAGDEILRKPFNHHELMKTVERALHG